MQYLCRYNSNPKRVTLMVDKLRNEYKVQFRAVEGTLIFTEKTSITLGDRITVVASIIEDNKIANIVLSNNAYFSAWDGKKVELGEDFLKQEGHYVQLYLLLKEKYGVTGNQFSIQFKGEGGGVIIASQKSGVIGFTVNTSAGNLYTESFEQVKEILSECTAIKSFCFTISSDDSEKEVIVRKGQAEILREISHYLNKTLMIGIAEEHEYTEYAVGASASYKLILKEDGQRIQKKFALTKLRVQDIVSICASNITVGER